MRQTLPTTEPNLPRRFSFFVVVRSFVVNGQTGGRTNRRPRLPPSRCSAHCQRPLYTTTTTTATTTAAVSGRHTRRSCPRMLYRRRIPVPPLLRRPPRFFRLSSGWKEKATARLSIRYDQSRLVGGPTAELCPELWRAGHSQQTTRSCSGLSAAEGTFGGAV